MTKKYGIYIIHLNLLNNRQQILKSSAFELETIKRGMQKCNKNFVLENILELWCIVIKILKIFIFFLFNKLQY